MKELKKLINTKTIVTLVMTAFLGFLLSGLWVPKVDGITELYCTAYGAVITYFFTRKENHDGGSTEAN